MLGGRKTKASAIEALRGKFSEASEWTFDAASLREWDPEYWGEEDDPAAMRATMRWIAERRWEFLENFSGKAVEMNGKLVVYRCIQLDDPEAYVKNIIPGKSLGIYWTWDYESAECYWGKGEGTDVILTGLVGLSAINIERTVVMNLRPDIGDAEREITLREGEPISLTDVSLAEEEQGWQFTPPLQFIA